MAVSARTYDDISLPGSLGQSRVLRAAVGQEVDNFLPLDAFVNTEASGQYSLVEAEPEPTILDEAVLLLRASSLDLGTYVVGDAWPNEGTAGSDYDAITGSGGDEPPDPGAPELIDDDGLGFAIDPTGGAEDYFYVPNGPAIEAGTGSFTAFAKVKWIESSGSYSNIMAKILNQMGVDGSGWVVASGSAVTGTAAIAADGNPSPDVAFATDSSGTGLDLGEHLVVIRLDRAEDAISIFVDDVLGGTGDASTVTTVEVEHQLIFGRGKAQIGRAYGYFDRALTDAEITVDLSAALDT